MATSGDVVPVRLGSRLHQWAAAAPADDDDDDTTEADGAYRCQIW